MAKRTCTVEGCNRPAQARGWCPMHYERWKRNGDPQATRLRPFEERFWARVEKTQACWIWRGTIMPNGYGSFTRPRRRPGSSLAHRIAYELLVGPIPEGLTLDHLCRVRQCVNPAHLEPVTNRENLMRGEGFSAQYAARSHCKHGHRFDEANTRLRANGSRQCRACDLEAYHRKKRTP